MAGGWSLDEVAQLYSYETQPVAPHSYFLVEDLCGVMHLHTPCGAVVSNKLLGRIRVGVDGRG